MSVFDSSYLDYTTAGNVLANISLNRYFINEGIRQNNELMDCIQKTNRGSVVFTTGSGRYNLMLVGGVHGNELSPQAALLRLMDNIIKDNLRIKCELHIIPFLIPFATMSNTRKFNSRDMNRCAHEEGITKKVVDYAKDNSMTALCDCHSTDPSNKPGFISVFCSVRPLIDSVKIAKHICMNTESNILPISDAGSVLHGALEDESNLRGIPAVTCETLEESGKISDDGVNFSYLQILSFLDYFGVL